MLKYASSHLGAEFDGRMRAWGACGGSSILPAPTYSKSHLKGGISFTSKGVAFHSYPQLRP